MLVIHGDKDYRVPIGEALRLWWDLRLRQDAPEAPPHRFLYFPDENHWILNAPARESSGTRPCSRSSPGTSSARRARCRRSCADAVSAVGEQKRVEPPGDADEARHAAHRDQRPAT
jgi:hypothetical protein